MMACKLAESYPKCADIVIGVPDSGLDAALGYAKKSGIPYGIGLIKNKYIGRTFISPGQNERLALSQTYSDSFLSKRSLRGSAGILVGYSP